MSKPIIEVENLSKLYKLGQIGATTIRDSYERWRCRLQGKEEQLRKIGAKHLMISPDDPQAGPEPNTIWALKGISFSVNSGEIIGIIGRNGAGKTTLLKVLSRITEPTKGKAIIRGRTSSLLEVGTGFHYELTGRENVYLNGAILGMKKQEIRRKFDEILDFAEIEKFIDTPLKRYSSGMYVRLAFAVAAHLEPEILLIDEVLAVGDAAFQKKCLGKMGDVAKEGRTVLFVSHNMAAVNRLCGYAMWLDRGRIQMIGVAESVVAAYLSTGIEAKGERQWENTSEAPGNERLRLRAVRVLNPDYNATSILDIRSPFYIEIEYEIFKKLPNVRVAFKLVAGDGSVVFTSIDSNDSSWERKTRYPGVYASRCEIPGNFLNEGQYSLTVSADIPFVEILLIEENVVSFHVEQTGGVSGQFPERWSGVICPALPWKIRMLKRTKDV